MNSMFNKEGRKVVASGLLIAGAMLLSACSHQQTTGETATPLLANKRLAASPAGMARQSAVAPDPALPDAADLRYRQDGSGRFHRTPRTSTGPLELGEKGLILNFENAELRDVARIILGDYLQATYLYDPRVQGTVTLQTTRELPPDRVLATLETLLRMNGGALIRDDDRYEVVPIEEAVRGRLTPQIGDSRHPLPAGYAVQIVTLRYMSALQMEQMLTPFVTAGAILRVDPDRNLLLIAGTSLELNKLNDIVTMFDVDWLAGKSVGLYPLDNVAPETLADELDAVFRSTDGGPLESIIDFTPLKRLNALLVTTQQASYLDRVESWIRRLDRANDAGQNLYVYYLQNGKAADVAKVLTEVFSNRDSKTEQEPRLAPGRKPVELASRPTETAREAAAVASPPTTPQRLTDRREGGGLAYNKGADIRIIADEINNAILVLASAHDYRIVTAALKKLDVVPLQVLVEATIAEVTLTDNLRYGVQWFLRESNLSGGRAITSVLTNSASTAISSTLPGFSAIVTEGATPRWILDALEKETSVNIMSSPHLMVLDNQSAELSVGQEVPIITRQQQSTDAANANIVNNIDYKNTGVIMKVTPRVNTGGTIIMEVEQEVSNVVPSAEETLTPTISKRSFKSSIVVHSGDTIVLGGLIQDIRTRDVSGLPGLATVPVIGPLFGTNNKNTEKTELIMLISPRLVRNQQEAFEVTDEIRQRLRQLQALVESRKPSSE